MTDLIYADDVAAKELKARFPAAVFEDASDMIHEERFSIELDDDLREDYYRWLIVEGWASVSLLVGVGILDKTSEDGVLIRKIIDTIKTQTPVGA